jgi:hypothetical protein
MFIPDIDHKLIFKENFYLKKEKYKLILDEVTGKLWD